MPRYGGEWTQSDAYRDAFQSKGRAELIEPHLIVAAAAGTTAMTFRDSWNELPSNAQILDALDETVAAIETLTPS